MKKIICLIFTLAVILGITAGAEGTPLTADRLNDGSYNITVTSSSSMFRITNCTLNVGNGKMTADMTLSGTGYEKLYMGKSADAENAVESDYIFFTDNDGKYTYTVPVEALDTETDCAAYSTRKQQWYDRTLVFESTSLPDGTVKSGGFNIWWILIPIFVAALAAAVIIPILKRKNV